MGRLRTGRHKLIFGPRAVLRGSHARGIFVGKSLSKVGDSNVSTHILPIFLTYEVPVAPVPHLDGKIVWFEVQCLCSIVKRYKTGLVVFCIGFSNKS